MPSKYYHRNFKPQYFYHIFNRGAYKHKIFHDQEDYQAFTDILIYYLMHPLAKKFSYQKLAKKPYVLVRNQCIDSVRLVAYCLMPNHFHFILKQMPSAVQKTNISNLMRRVMITYSMYFQYKYKHNGTIFQGRYKNVLVDSQEQLLHLSRYIHQHQTPYSSLSIYLKQLEPLDWLYPKYVLKLTNNYSKFLNQSIKKTAAKTLEPLLLE